MGDNPLSAARRHDSSAMGPCFLCGRQILATGVPVFYRVNVEQCGVDMNEVRQHVGLAMAMGGGADGLALAEIMGPRRQPVVVLGEGTQNICQQCAADRVPAIMTIALDDGPGEDGE